MKEFVEVKKKIRDHLEKLDMHCYQVHFEKKYNLEHDPESLGERAKETDTETETETETDRETDREMR